MKKKIEKSKNLDLKKAIAQIRPAGLRVLDSFDSGICADEELMRIMKIHGDETEKFTVRIRKFAGQSVTAKLYTEFVIMDAYMRDAAGKNPTSSLKYKAFDKQFRRCLGDRSPEYILQREDTSQRKAGLYLKTDAKKSGKGVKKTAKKKSVSAPVIAPVPVNKIETVNELHDYALQGLAALQSNHLEASSKIGISDINAAIELIKTLQGFTDSLLASTDAASASITNKRTRTATMAKIRKLSKAS